MEEKVYFRNQDGLKLCGILTKPEKETENCIILCHGITVDKEEGGFFTNLAMKLSCAGFAVLRFDFRGHGESEGKSVDMTVTGEKNDLESAVGFLKDLGYNNFGLLGASFGGGAVSLFVPERPDIKALVLWKALIDYHGLLEPELPWPKKYFGKEAMQKLEENGFIEIGSSGLRVGKNLFTELRSLEPWKALTRTNIPILFIHGNKDTYVSYEDSVKYSKLLKNAKLKTIHGADHSFHDNKEQEDETNKASVDFFLETLT